VRGAAFAAAAVAAGVASAAGAAPASVTAAGSFQSEVGCPGDWDPACAATHLAKDPGDGVWQAAFSLPAGSYEYKVAIDDSWTENYPVSNLALPLGAPTLVKFYYDEASHWVVDDASGVIAAAAGSFQSELGCPGDWQPECLRSWLKDPDGDGSYGFRTQALLAGSYEAKVAHEESWDENYGAGGVPNGSNIPFTVPADFARMSFAYDPATHLLTVSVPEPSRASLLAGALVLLAARALLNRLRETGARGYTPRDAAKLSLLEAGGCGSPAARGAAARAHRAQQSSRRLRHARAARGEGDPRALLLQLPLPRDRVALVRARRAGVLEGGLRRLPGSR
jgi:hypothetical protein